MNLTMLPTPPIDTHPRGGHGALLAELADRPAWIRDALCAQVDPELFYPEQGDNARDAKRVCARCPVIAECREYALEHDEQGIWGGTSERERRREALRRGETVAQRRRREIAERRAEVAALRARGRTATQIAEQLGTTRQTVGDDLRGGAA